MMGVKEGETVAAQGCDGGTVKKMQFSRRSVLTAAEGRTYIRPTPGDGHRRSGRTPS